MENQCATLDHWIKTPNWSMILEYRVTAALHRVHRGEPPESDNGTFMILVGLDSGECQFPLSCICTSYLLHKRDLVPNISHVILQLLQGVLSINVFHCCFNFSPILFNLVVSSVTSTCPYNSLVKTLGACSPTIQEVSTTQDTSKENV